MKNLIIGEKTCAKQPFCVVSCGGGGGGRRGKREHKNQKEKHQISFFLVIEKRKNVI